MTWHHGEVADFLGQRVSARQRGCSVAYLSVPAVPLILCVFPLVDKISPSIETRITSGFEAGNIAR
jgi:hypothetical protein